MDEEEAFSGISYEAAENTNNDDNRRRQIPRWMAGSTFFLVSLSAIGPWLLWSSWHSRSVATSAALTTLTVNDVGPKVNVELYGMAGCPYTRAFIEGPLAETLTVLSDYVDFRFYPFGNSYYATSECGGAVDPSTFPFASYFKGYNASVRSCWDAICGASAAEPSGDCFSGQLLCQHGATDCMMTTAWACAKSMTGEDTARFMPFVTCTAKHFLEVTTSEMFSGVLKECAQAADHLEDTELEECALGDSGVELLNQQARLTKPHAGVPYVLVNGAELEDTGCVACGDGIVQKVCEALRDKGLTGDKEIPVCAGIFGEI